MRSAAFTIRCGQDGVSYWFTGVDQAPFSPNEETAYRYQRKGDALATLRILHSSNQPLHMSAVIEKVTVQ